MVTLPLRQGFKFGNSHNYDGDPTQVSPFEFFSYLILDFLSYTVAIDFYPIKCFNTLLVNCSPASSKS
jgi:hypothetical protein